jgi:glycosyltransferase involved in cell wall biosynthesis
MDLSVIILTHNEADNLPRCLTSLAVLQCPVFIVDSGSTDQTIDISLKHGCACYNHPFETHSKQWQWALSTLPIKTRWVLCLDADQSLSPDLAADIKEALSTVDDVTVGFYIRRQQVFRGSLICHGGYGNKYLLKLFRMGAARLVMTDKVDHHFYVAGRTKKVRGFLIEDNFKEHSISFWIEKHIRYAELMAEEECDIESVDSNTPIRPSITGNPDQRTLWFKDKWRRMPLFIRPTLYFAYRYLWLGGFLDGKNGFVFHFLQGFWFRLLVDINIDELRRANRLGRT